MNTVKKVFTVGVVFTTILWAVGFAAFVPVANAASAGDLIKASGAAVYYYAEDGKRYVFPNETTYMSWYSDFSGVVTITDSELAAISIGGNVTMRPGTKLVKITTDPKVYAVSSNGTLHWVETEALAITLYGADWASKVVDVPDAFFVNYTVGDSVSTEVHPDGSLVKYEGGADVYLIENGEKRKIADDAAFNANRFQAGNILTIPDTVTYPNASDVTGEESVLTTVSGTSSGTTVEASVTVSLAADSPAGATLPLGANNVDVLKFNLTTSNAVTLTGATVKRLGVGAVADFANVYMYDGATRLTSGRSLSSDTHTATFTNLGVDLIPGTTKAVTLAVDITNNVLNSGNEDYFQLTDLTFSGTTVSGLPVSGNSFTVGTAAAGNVQVSKSGTVTNPTVGSDGVKLASFKVTAGTEDVALHRIALTQGGSISSADVMNLKLYQGSTMLAETSGLTGQDLVVFDLTTPFEIEDGQNKIFEVKGDVDGRPNETVRFYLDEDTDILAVGGTYGFGQSVTRTAYDNSAVDGSDASWSTLQGGQITVSFNGPSATNVAENSDDTTFMDFTITSDGQSAEVRQVTVEVCKVGGNMTANDQNWLTNLKGWDEAGTAFGPVDVNTGAIGVNNCTGGFSGSLVTFTDRWNLDSSDPRDMMVTMDVSPHTTAPAVGPAGNAYYVVLGNFGGTDIKSLDTNDYLTDIVPSTPILANNMTITAAGLTVSTASTPTSGTRIKGEQDADAAGFLFQATDSSDVTVTEVTLSAESDTDNPAHLNGIYGNGPVDDDVQPETIFSSVSLYEDGTKIAGPEAIVTATNRVTFDNLNWTVPAGETKKLTAKVDISTTAPYGGNSDFIYLDIADIAVDVVSQDEEGNDVTEAGTNKDNYNGGTIRTLVTVAGAGTLAVATHPDTPDSALLESGDTDVMLGKYEFTSVDEAFKVTKLSLFNIANADNDSVSSVKVSYTKEDSTTETKTGYFANGGANGEVTFADLELWVPANDDAILDVYYTLNTTTAGADNGDTPEVNFDLTAANDFEAVAQGSGTTVTALTVTNNVGVDSNAHTVYESFPAIAFDASSPVGNLTRGPNTKVAVINVTAGVNKKITWENGNANLLPLQINDPGGSAGNVTVKDGGDTLCTGAIAAGQYVCNFATNDLIISKGTTKRLDVFVDTSGMTVDDSLTVWLDEGSTLDWDINGVDIGYDEADKIFRGDLFGGAITVK